MSETMPKREIVDKSALAIQLRQWESQQRRFRSREEMARSLGIPKSTLWGYFTGRSLPTSENLSKLIEATQLSILEELRESLPRPRNEAKSRAIKDAKSLRSRVAAVKRSFNSLAEELESLVGEAENGSEARAGLKNTAA